MKSIQAQSSYTLVDIIMKKITEMSQQQKQSTSNIQTFMQPMTVNTFHFESNLTLWEAAYDIFVVRFRPKNSIKSYDLK